MARNTLTKPAMAPKLIKSFVRRLSVDPSLGVVQVSVNRDYRWLTTLIDAKPFDFESDRPIFELQHEILRSWPEDEPVYGFRLVNLRELNSDGARQELLDHPEAEVLYQRP